MGPICSLALVQSHSSRVVIHLLLAGREGSMRGGCSAPMFSSTDQLPPACSLLCTMFKVNLYLLQWLSITPQIQHSNVSAECLLSKAELPSLQQAFCTCFPMEMPFSAVDKPSTSDPGSRGVFPLIMAAFRSGCSTLQPFQCPL